VPWGGPGEFRRQVGVTFSDLLGKDASIRVEDRSVAIPLIQPVDREKERVYRQRGLRKGKNPPAKVAPIHALETYNRHQENPTGDDVHGSREPDEQISSQGCRPDQKSPCTATAQPFVLETESNQI